MKKLIARIICEIKYWIHQLKFSNINFEDCDDEDDFWIF